MDSPDRIRRPIPERTRPRRNVLGALGQQDAMAERAPGPDEGGHPLGPGFGDFGLGQEDALGLIDEGVRAASDLVDAHIRQGEETARALGKGAASIPLAQTDVSGLVTGLVRAYSDAASLWVEIVGSLAQRIERAPAPQPGPQAAAGLASPIGLSISSAGRVEAGIEMFRPASGLVPQPLTAAAPAPPAQITDVRFEASGAAGRIRITVPDGQAPGTYHGLLLSAADQSPVGALTLTVQGAAPPGPLP